MKIQDTNKLRIFICIGSNKIIGDSLGPLVGTYLKSKFNNNIIVYGDITNPVNFNSIDRILQEIRRKYNEKTVRILIDAALGKNVGSIVINSKELNVGIGLNKAKKINGDISIKGIVGKNYNDPIKNYLELKNKSFDQINDLAMQIVDTIN